MKYLSLFTGIGGFEVGIQHAWKSQRYKCLGNAVTTNVIRNIMIRLFKEIE